MQQLVLLLKVLKQWFFFGLLLLDLKVPKHFIFLSLVHFSQFMIMRLISRILIFLNVLNYPNLSGELQ